LRVVWQWYSSGDHFFDGFFLDSWFTLIIQIEVGLQILQLTFDLPVCDGVRMSDTSFLSPATKVDWRRLFAVTQLDYPKQDISDFFWSFQTYHHCQRSFMMPWWVFSIHLDGRSSASTLSSLAFNTIFSKI
jgi:hypothetical protein